MLALLTTTIVFSVGCGLLNKVIYSARLCIKGKKKNIVAIIKVVVSCRCYRHPGMLPLDHTFVISTNLTNP